MVQRTFLIHKTFKEWLKHVGGLWTSKEEWAKLGRWETWKTP